MLVLLFMFMGITNKPVLLEETETLLVPGQTAVAEGRCFILNRMDKQCYCFDLYTGKYLFRFIDPGEGPGELWNPNLIRIAPNNELLITSLGSRRTNVYDSDGNFKETLKDMRQGWPIFHGSEYDYFSMGRVNGFIHVVDCKTSLTVNSFGVPSKRTIQSHFFNGNFVALKIIAYKGIVFSDPFDMTPTIYDMEGNKIVTLEVDKSLFAEWDGESFPETWSDANLEDWFDSFDIYGPSFSFLWHENSYIVLSWKRNHQAKNYVTQIFNLKGELIDILQMKNYRPVGFDAGNLVFQKYDPEDEELVNELLLRKWKGA